MRALWWLKRDLRVSDNEALSRALDSVADTGEILPVFVVEPSVISAPDTSSLHWIAIRSALAGLRASLRSIGSELAILTGELPDAFEALGARLPFDAIFAEEETGVELTFRRDRRVRAWSARRGKRLVEVPHNGVIRALSDRDRRMELWRQRVEGSPVPAPSRLPMSSSTRQFAAATEIPDQETLIRLGLRVEGTHAGVQRCDEMSARATLDSFLRIRSMGYASSISSPTAARFHGSRLSVHLAWGTISLRAILQSLSDHETALREERNGNADAGRLLRSLGAVRSRLYWHDHFSQRLETEPTMERLPLNRAFEEVDFDGTDGDLAAWCEGRTGFPMVDASIRSLRLTGFLNFRMRAMIVSFACHVLHLDWRAIRDPMARIMADFLPGIHLSQLQMQAGVVGINTVRVYSPTKQLLDHDPDCHFVKRFVPELREHSCEEIRAYAVASAGSKTAREKEQRRSGLVEGFGSDREATLGSYPKPIADYASAAAEMKRRLYTIKRSPEGRAEAERVLRIHGSRRSRRSRRGRGRG